MVVSAVCTNIALSDLEWKSGQLVKEVDIEEPSSGDGEYDSIADGADSLMSDEELREAYEEVHGHVSH